MTTTPDQEESDRDHCTWQKNNDEGMDTIVVDDRRRVPIVDLLDTITEVLKEIDVSEVWSQRTSL